MSSDRFPASPSPDAAGGPLLLPAADTLLLQVDHPSAESCRAELAAFAELESSPEHVHTYRLRDLGLWNARAAGVTPAQVTDILLRWCTGPVPHAVLRSVTDTMDRFGRVTIEGGAVIREVIEGGAVGCGAIEGSPGEAVLAVRTDDEALLSELVLDPSLGALLGPRLNGTTAALDPANRGRLKQRLVELRWPADDRAALSPGAGLPIGLDPGLELRPYQRQAVDSWLPSGNGVVVLPCGAGKTVTAIAAAAAVGANTLVLVTGDASLQQWHRELTRFTTLDPELIGCYSARSKQLRPVTIATYNVLTTKKDGRLRHAALMEQGDWGLVVYDEVHLLPSAVFGLTAGIQARRRLGLTATLIREDGRQGDVFSLIGPKRFDVPWRDLELQGWLAPATCTEVRVVPSDAERLAHAHAAVRDKPHVAATVGAKAELVGRLLARHPGEPALVIGTYLDGLGPVAEALGAPLVTGATPTAQRLAWFDQLRNGELGVLVVSKVANFSLDLPEVSVAVQVSGTFGSRQEEAQRLGRILRPKADGRQAHFYTLVARDTVEQEYAQRRQRFLAEQGYAYEIIDGHEL
ncbi:MAG: DEAD/DEAH box helicase [Acidimicrobiia bacterium]|nr:DEAD/DEAH box helicase [Acidimicrobiia bacterium]